MNGEALIMTRRRSATNRNDVSIEIDYEKLAEAIILAQEKTKNEKRKNSNLRSKIMRFMNGIIYIMICAFFFGVAEQTWLNSQMEDVISIVKTLFIIFLLIVCGIFAFFCQQESLNDNWEETQIHFSTNISIIALITAIVTFLGER